MLDSKGRRQVAATFRRQLGLITADQARAAGVTRTMVATRLRRQEWEAVLPRVYRHVVAPRSRRQSILAAVLYCGPGAMAHGLTSLELRQLVPTSADGISVVVPPGRQPRHAAIHVVRSRTIGPADRSRVGPVPATSVARALVESAAALGEEELERVLEEGLRRRLTSMPRLLDAHTRMHGRGHPGSAHLGRLLAERDMNWVALDRELERRTHRLLERSGLPRPVRQHPVALPGFTAHLDFAWPAERVALEVDGWGPHSGRRRHHLDRERWSLLVDAGWRLQIAGWDHVVHDAGPLLDRLAHLLGNTG